MTTPPLPNALTPEEWAAQSAADGLYQQRIDHDGDLLIESDTLDVRVWPDRRHALAALALHGQPFGFTREDLAFLRDIPKMVEDRTMTDADERRAASLAARIEILLPPLDAQPR